jgi:hypothetical protein
MCEDMFNLDYTEIMKVIDGDVRVSSIFVL